ncbi:MAG: transporter substrate-binding domain-containing protein [Rhodobacteraceae bacterium]|nr:transporter substrate-binding domain-containing protein [Paracoccaceae bacterium]
MTINRRALMGLIAGAAFAVSAVQGIAAGVLRVGSYPANPPWEFKDASGAFQGFEVDIVNEIAKRLGMTTDIQGLDFKALFVATASHRVDIVISSLTITNDRLQSQSFTQPIVTGALGIATKDGAGVTSVADLKGKTVGAIATSFGEKWLKDRAAEIGYTDYKSYDTVSNMLTDLTAGRVDAVANDVVGLRYAMNQMKGLAVPVEIPTGEKFAMMLPKGSDMLEKINSALSDMKTDGTMATIYKKWFGVDPAAGSVTLTPMPVPTSAD